MNKFIIIVILALLMIPKSSPAEISKEAIQQLLIDEQFVKLDSIAEEIRKNRQILDDGSSEITILYNNLCVSHDNEKEIVRLINVFDKWRRAYPKSPTPLIALSSLYRDYAWSARGSGWARTITDEQWDLFYERMKKADEYANSKFVASDMRGYAERIRNIRAIGGKDAKDRAYAVLEQGIAIDPDYHSMYLVMADLLMEKWYGDNKYEVINFIDKYSTRSKGINREVLYIKILLFMSNYYEIFNYLNNFGLSWPDLEVKFKRVLRERPDDKFTLNAYWYFAGMALDFDRAKELGAKLDKMNGWIKNPWWDSRYKISEAIKLILLRRNQIAVFTINAAGIATDQSNLVSYYEFYDAAGNKIGGVGGEQETLTFSELHSNYDYGKIIRFAKIPSALLKGILSVKYTIENPNTGKKVEASKTFDFAQQLPELQELNVFWNKNLLKNPCAENGVSEWTLYGKGGTLKADIAGRGNIFFTTDFLDITSNLHQDVALPQPAADAYMAVAGYLSVDEEFAGTGSKWPYIYGYLMYDINKIASYLNADTMRYDCKTKCWQARWGIFKVPAATESIRLIMSHSTKTKETPGKSRFYFDDLEIRIFKTHQEAMTFIDSYKEKHPQVLFGN